MKRIQRKRAKGWKMPRNAVYVGRPSVYGNPFVVGKDGNASRCIAHYLQYLHGIHTMAREGDAAACRMMHKILELQGKNLACWCPPGKPCHADVLINFVKGLTHTN